MWIRLPAIGARARRISCFAPSQSLAFDVFRKALTRSLPFPDQIDDCALPHCRSFSQAAALEIVDSQLPADLPVPDPKLAEIIKAIPRAGDGTAISGRERRAGRVPGVVYSQEDGHKGGHAQLISVETKQIARLLKRIGWSFFLSRTFELEIRPAMDSEDIISRERVLPRNVHLHAGTDAILNVTFIRAPPHAVLKVDVPLLYRGEDACPGIRKGGSLNTIKRVVRFRCPADHIPPYVEVDLSDLEIKERVLMRDLKVHPSLKLVHPDSSLPVCKVMGSRYVEPSAAPA